MAEASVIIALLSFVVSAVALYFSQFTPPRITSVLGPSLQIYYPADGGFGIYAPATFVNASPRTGTVQRCAITLFDKAHPNEKFFMAWRFFARLTPQLSFEFEANAHALGVLGSSSMTKQLWLTWRSYSTPRLVISEGDYALLFHYWVGSESKPRTEVHEFTVDQETYAQLEECRVSGRESTAEILLDHRIGGNKLMTADEARTLLGV
jgi:hypothetical protein